jgi:alpha-L-arabinofuranosidase
MVLEPKSIVLVCAFVLAVGAARPGPAKSAQPPEIVVDVAHPGHAISPTLNGIFFEEINHSGDGGLYAEMVRNRSFEESDTIEPWTLRPPDNANGTATVVDRADGQGFNRHALKVTVESGTGSPLDVVNDGYWGMAVQAGKKYDLSFSAKADAPSAPAISIRLESPTGDVLATAGAPAVTQDWTTAQITLTPSADCNNTRLVLRFSSPGTALIDMVSLFPEETFAGRPNGLRKDLADKLNDLTPAFVRFPGGCWVEGDTMATSLRWKQTIGDVAARRTQYNLWQYQSGNGLGFHEYLQLCEDLKAEPLFVINCGMSHKEIVPIEKMGEYVQDAVDAIEYANGSPTSTWGAKRAAAGHPAPFNLKYMEIGNENGGPPYNERYALFYDAIKAKYPSMHLIADNWGGLPTSRPVEIEDEHYYSKPGFFTMNAGKFDTYNRKGPKVYVGEYAVTEGCGGGNLAAALGEAAFMTGLERNSDVVILASYAPLFANVNYKRWNPNLINFDSSRVYGTPSYYVQQLFRKYRGDAVLPVKVTGPSEAPSPVASGGIGIGTWRTQAEFRNVRVSHDGADLLNWTGADGPDKWKPASGDWSIQDGAWRQMDLGDGRHAFTGDASWTDYTLSLQARKIAGREGFLIWVRVRDNDNWIQWNIGGWDNQESAVQVSTNGSSTDITSHVKKSIETGRWYDIRVDVAGNRVRCYLDGKLVHNTTIPEARTLFAAASTIRSTRDVIVKVVNTSDRDLDTRVKLSGAKDAAADAEAVVLKGSPEEENSLDQPEKVAPVRTPLAIAGAEFGHVFPAHSVTVLTFKHAAR